jgi:hypothetical protein
MDPLPIGLVILDELNGGKQMRRLGDGWMHRESMALRRLRAVGARTLVVLAARLDPASAQPGHGTALRSGHAA